MRIDGHKLRRARTAPCYSQKFLARLCECDHNTISRAENGRVGLGGKLANRIAAALGVAVEEIMEDLPPPGNWLAKTQEEADTLAAMRRGGPVIAREIRAYAVGISHRDVSGGGTAGLPTGRGR